MERIIHEFRFYGIDVEKAIDDKLQDACLNTSAREAVSKAVKEVLSVKPEGTDFIIHIPDELKEQCDVSPLLKEYECDDLTDFI